MQFRAEIVDGPYGRTLRLAGRLDLEQSLELVHLYDHAQRAVRLDLSDLVSADAAGLETLRMLQGRGAELVGLTPYLVLQFESGSSGAINTRHPNDLLTSDATRLAFTNTRMKEDR